MSDVRSASAFSSIPRGLSSEDEGVRIAISALGDMRDNARTGIPLPIYTRNVHSSQSAKLASRLTVTLSASASASNGHQYLDAPLQTSSLACPTSLSFIPPSRHENTKASSRMVNYGTEMMESSASTFYRPVLGRLHVNQLDAFACRQLDRLSTNTEARRVIAFAVIAPNGGRTPVRADRDERQAVDHRHRRMCMNMLPTSLIRIHRGYNVGKGIRQEPVSSSRSCSRGSNRLLLEAGGVGAAVSEESMRKLKYCLQWLQYATEHIDGQILKLRDFIVSLQLSTANSSTSPDALISPSHLRTFTDIHKDVVHTLRQVVDIVSKYAGGALPEPARSRVRGFMLHLPQRWASATQGLPVESSRPSVPSHGTSSAAEAASSGGGVGGATRRGRQARQAQNRNRGTATPANSRPVSPISSPRVKPKSIAGAAGGVGAGETGTAGPPAPTAGSSTAAAQRILTLAMESLDMMRGVTPVMKESLDRADAWVERLRVVGIQRGQISEQQSQAQSDDMPLPPPPSSASSSDVNGSSSSSSTLAHRRKHSLPHLTSSTSTSAVSTPAQDTPYSSVPTTPIELSLGAVHQLNQVQVQQSPMGAAQMQSLPPLAALSLGGRVVEEKAGTGAVVGDGGREAMDVDA
ncbi:Opi1-domain-containing protein [Coniophora puteana RWD-64-598 SS2]|uniref:Opi1-domain-containing protein n=1 Tax=Coniophora puteana (strain RWD-64-598) TaxID=741705 RepID=A0A5M3MI95_CONPW|nr:Opi1-domain-containing protein [Coniophora puteana RWD-64-598 SS2]EIW78813.1 Opi1-domain-containing protein [Coniophora puteana RWD-64-598 SS2]